MSLCFWSEYLEAAIQTLHLCVVRMAKEGTTVPALGVSGQVGMARSSSLRGEASMY